MTDETLTEILALATASSPATDYGQVSRDDAIGLADKTSPEPMLWCSWLGPVDDSLITAITGNGPTSEANARFYSCARGAVVSLVAEVRRLRAENADLREKAADLKRAAVNAEADAARFQSEVACCNELISEYIGHEDMVEKAKLFLDIDDAATQDGDELRAALTRLWEATHETLEHFVGKPHPLELDAWRAWNEAGGIGEWIAKGPILTTMRLGNESNPPKPPPARSVQVPGECGEG